MYGMDDAPRDDQTIVKVESENVMDILSILNQYVYSFNWDKYIIDEYTWGFCCDTGNYSDEYTSDNLGEVYWTLVNFGGDSEREPTNYFAIEYSVKDYGAVDGDKPLTVFIYDKDCGEFTNRSFTVTRKQ